MSRLALFGGERTRTKAFPSWPMFDQREETALLEVLHSGKWWGYSYGEGVHSTGRDTNEHHSRHRVTEFQEAFARMQGAQYGIGCATGTAALEIALKALGIGPGDEVIVPPYSFIATATAVLIVNAVPIFCDIDPDTYNLSPEAFERAITPRTKAVIPVHFAGMAADMDAILEIAKRHGLAVLEDAAHAHGATWKDRGLGCIGHAGTFSFQASKNMTSGEGGLITTNDREFAELCESLLWAGRKVGREWYEHFRLGWNYRLTEFQGALLLVQLERLQEQNELRMRNAAHLTQRLKGIPGIHPLERPGYATRHSYHIYIFRFRENEFGISRKDFLAALSSEGIPCSSGYAHPLYKNVVFLEKNFYPKGCPIECGHYNQPIDYRSFEDVCPNAERACHEAVWLEHRQLLGDQQDMDDIVRAVSKIYSCKEEFQDTSVGTR